MAGLTLLYIGVQPPDYAQASDFLPAWPAGSVFPITKALTIIGRDAARSDIVLTSPHIARRHAYLQLTVASTGSQACWLHDLGGTNGTYTQGIEGRELLTCNDPPRLLHINDRIWIAGLYEFELAL